MCTKRNVVYENVCLNCHPEAGEGKEVKEGGELPAIYVGETCRSLAERGAEHWADYRAGAEGSHIFKHHVVHHKGAGQPKFHLRPVRYYRTALGRQVGEAVRIRRRGEGNLLNSKTEFNRCHITRLSLPQKELPDDTAPPALTASRENCLGTGQEAGMVGQEGGGQELLEGRRDEKDKEERTARGWQVSPTKQVKRQGQVPEQGRTKLAKLELPVVVRKEDETITGNLPVGNPTANNPVEGKLPGQAQDSAGITADRQPCMDQFLPSRSRDVVETKPLVGSRSFAASVKLPELPGAARASKEGEGTDTCETALAQHEPCLGQGGREENETGLPSSASFSQLRERACTQPASQPECLNGYVTRPEHGRFCNLHQQEMTLKPSRITSWKQGSNGLHRRVFKVVKVWSCKKPDRVQITLEPKSGEQILNPAQGDKLYKLFTKRSRK